MASILVVDDDLQLAHSLTRNLRAHGYDASSAGSLTEALQCLRERAYDVLLTDLRMEGGDGMDLILALRESSPGTRPVLMSAHVSARDGQRALDLGAVRVLCKPFEIDEMLAAVERAAEYAGGFLASLHGLTLVDTLQMFHYSRRSLSARLLGGVPAAFHMQDGQLVHAEHGAERGEAALAAILKMPAGSLRTSALEAVTPSIFQDFQGLLLNQLRQLDERERDSKLPPLPAALIDAAFFDLDEEPTQSSTLPGKGVGAASRADRPSPTSGERPAVRVVAKAQTLEKVDIACERVVSVVEGGVACGVIDLDTGTLLGSHTSGGFSEEQKDVVASAMVDLFRGTNISRIDAMVRGQAGDAGNEPHHFEEVQLASKHNLHFAKTLKGGRAVIMLVTTRATSLGMGWAQLRAAIPILERLLP